MIADPTLLPGIPEEPYFQHTNLYILRYPRRQRLPGWLCRMFLGVLRGLQASRLSDSPHLWSVPMLISGRFTRIAGRRRWEHLTRNKSLGTTDKAPSQMAFQGIFASSIFSCQASEWLTKVWRHVSWMLPEHILASVLSSLESRVETVRYWEHIAGGKDAGRAPYLQWFPPSEVVRLLNVILLVFDEGNIENSFQQRKLWNTDLGSWQPKIPY